MMIFSLILRLSCWLFVTMSQDYRLSITLLHRVMCMHGAGKDVLLTKCSNIQDQNQQAIIYKLPVCSRSHRVLCRTAQSDIASWHTALTPMLLTL